MQWTHGTAGLLIPLALTAAGVLAGMIVGRAPIQKIVAFPLITIPIFLIAAILWSLAAAVLKPKLGDTPVLAYLGSVFCVLIGGLAGKLLANTPPTTGHKRGTQVQQGAPLAAKSRRPGSLTLAGLPVDTADETKHFKIIGTTGTGKSTAIRELLAGALARGDRAVIADADGSYMERFYDAHRGDVLLNPFDPRAARWDLFAEMQSPIDAEQLARSLIADTDGQERNWRNYARVFLASLLRQLHRVDHTDVGELYQLIATTPVDELRDLLSDTPAGPYFDQDNGKFFGAVRAVANTHLSVLEHVAGQRATASLSIRHWVRRAAGAGTGCLFLPYRANEIATLRGLISTWMRLAIFETMNGAEGGQRLWFIVDELDALGPIDGLKDALARLRKFGGRCVLGFQSIAQVSGTYGQHEAQTIVENCGNTLILRCSSSENGGTARFASKLIGEREILREQVTEGRSGDIIFAADHRSVSRSTQHITEMAVLPSEIEQLADLQGYLKFASTPMWQRVDLTWQP